MNNSQEKSIYYLEELSDYKVASGYPDIRDWKVEDSMGRVIGEVENLIVNKNAERVVYVDIELDDDFINDDSFTRISTTKKGSESFVNAEGERHIIIPVGFIELDEDDKKVRTSQVETRLLAQARRKNRNAYIDQKYEIDTINHYSKDDAIVTDMRVDDNFYKRPEFQSSVYRS